MKLAVLKCCWNECDHVFGGPNAGEGEPTEEFLANEALDVADWIVFQYWNVTLYFSTPECCMRWINTHGRTDKDFQNWLEDTGYGYEDDDE